MWCNVPGSDPGEERVNIIGRMAPGPLLLSAGLLIVAGYAYGLTWDSLRALGGAGVRPASMLAQLVVATGNGSARLPIDRARSRGSPTFSPPISGSSLREHVAFDP